MNNDSDCILLLPLLPGTTNRKWCINIFMAYFSEFVFYVVLITSLTAYVFMGFASK
jgi:hypothetical protein